MIYNYKRKDLKLEIVSGTYVFSYKFCVYTYMCVTITKIVIFFYFVLNSLSLSFVLVVGSPWGRAVLEWRYGLEVGG